MTQEELLKSYKWDSKRAPLQSNWKTGVVFYAVPLVLLAGMAVCVLHFATPWWIPMMGSASGMMMGLWLSYSRVGPLLSKIARYLFGFFVLAYAHFLNWFLIAQEHPHLEFGACFMISILFGMALGLTPWLIGKPRADAE